MKPGLLYRILKRYIPLGYRFFYKKLQVEGLQNVPIKGPIIFAINHQNAFMDALIIATTSPRNPWFITRASVFSSSLLRFWLRKLQMLPIYRFRDGMSEMKKNEQALDAVQTLLKEGRSILIFPEGNHDRRWRLRPLQKGIARIAFTLEEESGFSSGLQIVPVGIQYEEHLHSGAEVLVSYGKPILIADYEQAFKENQAKAIRQLLELLKQRIQSLMIHIESENEYEQIKKAIQNRPQREKDLAVRLQADQGLVANYSAENEPLINPTPSKSLLLKAIYVLAVIPHILSLLLIGFVVKKTVRDDHWTSSVKFAVMLFGAPLFYILQALLLMGLGCKLVGILLYFLLIPLSGRFVVYYRQKFRSVM